MYQELWSDESFEQMLDRTVYSDTTKDILLDKWYSLDDSEEFEALEKLSLQDKVMNNLADPITSGFNYQQKDILRKLKHV